MNRLHVGVTALALALIATVGCSIKKNGATAPNFAVPNTPTNTFTPTATGTLATLTFTRTSTGTPTNTFTPAYTATGTLTPPTATFTSTWTGTPTATLTPCQANLLSLYGFESDLQCWRDHVGDNSVDGTVINDSTDFAHEGTRSFGARVPFTASSQHEQFEVNFATTTSLAGMKMSVWVYVTDAVAGSGQCDVKLLDQSGSGYAYEDGSTSPVPNKVSPNSWTQITWIPPFTASGADANDVKRIGLQIYSGDSGAPTAGMVYFDQFEILPIASPTPTTTGTQTPLTSNFTPTQSLTATASSTMTPSPTGTQTVGTPTFTPSPTVTACSGGYYAPLFTFDTGTQCWLVDYNPQSLLAAATWDPSVGNPSAGSVSLFIPFSGPNQQLVFDDTFGSTPTNLTGKTLTVRVRLDSGLNASASFPGGVKLIVKSTASYYYASTNWVNLDSQSGSPTWTTLTFNCDSPFYTQAGYLASQIVQFGLEFNTGGSGTFVPAALHIDDFEVN